jgi:hypothetical protein
MPPEPVCCKGCGRDTTSPTNLCMECGCGAELKTCASCRREHRLSSRLCDECREFTSEEKYHGEGYE